LLIAIAIAIADWLATIEDWRPTHNPQSQSAIANPSNPQSPIRNPQSSYSHSIVDGGFELMS